MIFTSLLVWTVSGALWLAGAVAAGLIAAWWLAVERLGWFEPLGLDGDDDGGDGAERVLPDHRHRLLGVAGATRHDELGRVLAFERGPGDGQAAADGPPRRNGRVTTR